MCGENSTGRREKSGETGSPPRVRGKQQKRYYVHAGQRITPACAGKTLTLSNNSPQSQDHPRVCGENVKRLYTRFLYSGSPPRVRGKPLLELYRRWSEGITPACAGKTLDSHSINDAIKDHPRVCGENCKPPCPKS